MPVTSESAPILAKEVKRRRTFAIISHPDAGKTTLTEKLLLYGGAIHLAGAVNAKRQQRNTTSDWMEIEKQRGISISTSVLRFEYEGIQLNLLDTPGHKDFSEDTYRTLVAVDAAVMLIDAAKGVEPQTRKLFEVCRLRGLPIFTFINKLDRPGRDPFDLIDELEKVLGIRSCPISWPIGMGPDFRGVYDRQKNELLLFQGTGKANSQRQLKSITFDGVDDPELAKHLSTLGSNEDGQQLQRELKDQLELIELAGDPFDSARVLAGQLTPVFFGSAMNNFGVQHFLETFLTMAPSPGPRNSTIGPVEPTTPELSGLNFKIQANMDPKHRDRVAFLRVCSGKFSRGITARHGRLDKDFKLARPLHFFAQEREIIEEAWPGDIVGLVDTSGDFRIGDTLFENRAVEYEGVPRFSPEFFAGVVLNDPLKRKQLKKGLDQLTEEGVVQIFYPPDRGETQPVLGAVGALQFEVLQHRIKAEYNVEMRLERLPYTRARWITAKDPGVDIAARLSVVGSHADNRYLQDRDGLAVILFASDWSVNWAQDNYKDLNFLTTAPLIRA
jgi:peptide chain release factor 3